MMEDHFLSDDRDDPRVLDWYQIYNERKELEDARHDELMHQ